MSTGMANLMNDFVIDQARTEIRGANNSVSRLPNSKQTGHLRRVFRGIAGEDRLIAILASFLLWLFYASADGQIIIGGNGDFFDGDSYWYVGSPIDFNGNDTNFWANLDGLNRAQAVVGNPLASAVDETYTTSTNSQVYGVFPYRPSSIDVIPLQYSISIIGGGPVNLGWEVVNSTNSGSGNTENTQTANLYVAMWVGFYGCFWLDDAYYSAHNVSQDDAPVLRGLPKTLVTSNLYLVLSVT